MFPTGELKSKAVTNAFVKSIVNCPVTDVPPLIGVASVPEKLKVCWISALATPTDSGSAAQNRSGIKRRSRKVWVRSRTTILRKQLAKDRFLQNVTCGISGTADDRVLMPRRSCD